jgi:hypothetical protein
LDFLTGARKRALRLAILGAGTTAFALSLAGMAAAQSIPGPLKVTDSGPSGSPGYAIKGITGFQNDAGVFGYGTAASSAINIDGVVGYVQTPQSVGVVGWSASTGTSAYGMYGYSATGPGVYGFNANGGAASIYGYNTSASGIAMHGYSTSGIGIVGSSDTTWGIEGTTDTSSSNIPAVVGFDESAVSGNFGVAGQSNDGVGVGAFSEGTANGGVAMYADSPNGNNALNAYNANGGNEAIYSYTDSGYLSGYFEAGDAAFYGLEGFSDYGHSGGTLGEYTGTGAEVFGGSGNAAYPVLMAEELVAGTYPFATYNYYSANPGPGPNDETFILNDTSGVNGDEAVNGSDAQVSGDLFVFGHIYVNCGSFPEVGSNAGTDCDNQISVKRTSTGAKVHTYVASQSLPTMEDFGEGRLVNGQATIPLDRTFASTIDPTRSYLVFITPEGDSPGHLYVASKSGSGFVVRESSNGHSTLPFEYRIVAHPYADGSTRLAVAGTELKARPAITHHMATRLANPRTPEFAAFQARNKAERTALIAHHGFQQGRTPARPPRPTLSSNLFRQP